MGHRAGHEPKAVDPLRLVMADDLTTLTDYAKKAGRVQNTVQKLALKNRASNRREDVEYPYDPFPEPVKETSFVDIYLESELDEWFEAYDSNWWRDNPAIRIGRPARRVTPDAPGTQQP